MKLPTKTVHQLVVVDVETSGTSLVDHSLISAAFVPIAPEIPPFSVYFAPVNLRWSAKAHEMFRPYEAEWTRQAVPPKDACSSVVEYVRAHFQRPITIIAHNVAFDFAFLRKTFHEARVLEADAFSHRAIDTHTLLFLAYLKGKVPESALNSSGAFAFFGIEVPPSERHTALGDAKATRELFLRLVEVL